MASTLLRSESRVVVIAGNCRACARPGRARRPSPHKQKQKPGTGAPLHTKEPVTVASFRTWRGWRENVARNRCLTVHLNKRSAKTGMGEGISTIINSSYDRVGLRHLQETKRSGEPRARGLDFFSVPQ